MDLFFDSTEEPGRLWIWCTCKDSMAAVGFLFHIPDCDLIPDLREN